MQGPETQHNEMYWTSGIRRAGQQALRKPTPRPLQTQQGRASSRQSLLRMLANYCARSVMRWQRHDARPCSVAALQVAHKVLRHG